MDTHPTRLLQEYPKGTWTDVGFWLQGWGSATKQREFPAAVACWGRLLAEESGSRWRVPALYWRGRAFEALKQTAEAKQAHRHPAGHGPGPAVLPPPGGRAVDVPESENNTPKPVPLASQPTEPPVAANGFHAQNARALRGLGLVYEAIEEWSEQVRSRPEERTGLAEACDAFLDLGRYDKAVWVGGRVLRPLFAQEGGKVPISGFWQCVYPLGHLDFVGPYAAERGLDPYLVLGLIRERAPLPRAPSPGPALGG